MNNIQATKSQSHEYNESIHNGNAKNKIASGISNTQRYIQLYAGDTFLFCVTTTAVSTLSGVAGGLMTSSAISGMKVAVISNLGCLGGFLAGKLSKSCIGGDTPEPLKQEMLRS